MSEEKASPCVLHIHGENIQVLPNAMFAIQYICLDPGEKPEVVSEKDVRPDPEPCDLLASYIQDEEVRHDFVKRIAQCPDVATLPNGADRPFQRGLLRLRGTGQTYQEQGIHQRHHPPAPLQARQELAQYPAGDREVCAGGGVEGLHILIFRGEMFAIKEKMDIFA